MQRDKLRQEFQAKVSSLEEQHQNVQKEQEAYKRMVDNDLDDSVCMFKMRQFIQDSKDTLTKATKELNQASFDINLIEKLKKYHQEDSDFIQTSYKNYDDQRTCVTDPANYSFSYPREYHPKVTTKIVRPPVVNYNKSVKPIKIPTANIETNSRANTLSDSQKKSIKASLKQHIENLNESCELLSVNNAVNAHHSSKPSLQGASTNGFIQNVQQTNITNFGDAFDNYEPEYRD